MVHPTSFNIVFNQEAPVYYSGSLISGNVILELPEFIGLRGVHLKFKGKCKVYWEEESSDSDSDSATKKESAKEKYLTHDMLIFGNQPGSDLRMELPAGRHSFPFQYQLPTGLPSSFSHRYGNVEYKAKCKVIRLSSQDDFKTSIPFSVIGILDLNMKPEYGAPLSGSDSKFICCCCCKSGPISANFSIQRMGWVSGEAIQLHAEIWNHSDRNIDKTYVILKQHLIFRADSGAKKEHVKEVARVSRPLIEASGHDEWETEVLNIPSLPPTNFAGCRIIENKYILELNVVPSGLALDLELPLEITIGTIPLGRTTITHQPAPYPAEPYPPVMMAGTFNQYPDVPPSYNEFMMMNQATAPPAGWQDPAYVPPQAGDQEKVKI